MKLLLPPPPPPPNNELEGKKAKPQDFQLTIIQLRRLIYTSFFHLISRNYLVSKRTTYIYETGLI